MIDVLIPAYNAAATVEQSLGTIQRQTRRDIRIVVVDDGSTDGTAAIVSRLAATDDRIDLIRQPNGGIVDALNRGLAACRAPLVARFDADDLSYPERFERQAAFLEAHPDVVAAGCSVRHIDESGRPTGTIAQFDDPALADALAAPSREPYICHPFLMVRRDALEAVGGYRYVFHAEDTDLYWRLQERGRLHNLGEVLGDYRMHLGSISSASIVNGRIAALFSQLAGIAAAKRRQGAPDLEFRKEMLAACKAAGTLEAMARIGERQLEGSERDRLGIMMAAKMMSLAAYRPFEVDLEDCRFSRDVIARHLHLLTPSNSRSVQLIAWSTAARLATSGKRREALALVGPRDYHRVVPRMAFRTLSTPRIRRFARRITGRSELSK